MMETRPDEIFSEIKCELGEGPSYDPVSGKLFWFDIVGRKLLEKSWPDGREIVHDLPFMASAVAFIDPERQLIAAEDGLYVRDAKTGAMALHVSLEADNPVTRSNDGRVHPCGALWIGTMGRNAERKAGAIYWFFRGELRQLYPEISIPNSICFSPDGKTAYFTDTAKGILFRVACDTSTGLPQGEPKVFLDHRRQHGGLDGSVVDADGRLWNARWGSGMVDCYTPEGERMASYAIPASQPSCPAFAGPGASRIVVTSAFQGLDGEARQADPEAGKTFLLDLEVRGRFEPRILL